MTAHWSDKLCRRLDNGPSSSCRVRMSRPYGRYFEDLPALPQPAAQAPEVNPFLPESPPLPHSTLPHAQAPTPQQSELSSLTVSTRPHIPPAQQLPPSLAAICAGQPPTVKAPGATVRTRVLAGRVTKSQVQPGSQRDRSIAPRKARRLTSVSPPAKLFSRNTSSIHADPASC